MKRYLRILALAGVVSVVGAACAEEGGGPSGRGGGGQIVEGGTLTLAISADVDEAFDPSKEYSALSWSIFECCLTRRLVAYNGLGAAEGGNELEPDLAADLPTVSEDGLTYTFTIRDGVFFGPPFQDREIVAQDFVTAIEREACSVCHEGGYSFYYSVIEGFDEFADGKADSVSGVSAPDDKTLVITLTQETGDFGFRMSMPAMTPMPAEAVEGHDKDYGRFLVATGPYMWEGSETLDFSLPADQQTPAAGYDPGRAWTLVRNPSWSADTDDLRPAHVDRIEVEINESTDVNYNKLQAGEIDMVYDGVPPKQILQQYTTDPELKSQLHVNPSDGLRYLAMNVAEPPFDDIHVRKALNLVMDKDALRRTRGGPLFGEIAGHIIPNGLLNDVLADYDPYATPNGQGDVEAAKAEMAQSAYDSDGDGVCDDPVCEDVLLVADREDPYPDQNAVIADSAAQIGVNFKVTEGDRYTFMYDKCLDPGAHAAFCPSVGWFKDYADALTFGPPLLGDESLGPESCCNYTQVGASPELLRKNGYEVTEAPSLDAQMDECAILPLGDERINCWAEVDRTAMEDVVPFIPWLFDNDVDIAGPNIVNYTYGSFAGLMSIQHVGVAGGAGA